ncbi:hypothetical protein AB7901_23915 [Klebsiella pneumoniae]|uniref:hypothetical protein n=1 Tax=Klebsiella pneumoniae TaxID=573 RepID=UPI00081BE6EA|nr:hypothetical protein [Klebsiella pneumoniae]OCV99913.1 hypothetical protein A9P96_23495 [Klebsiella pneumoniae]HBV6644893.1 hypothetical protein [Klebsiella pneumoniae]
MSPQISKDLKSLIVQWKWNLLILFLIALASYWLKDKVSYNDIKDILGVLQNISAAIFTIVGLWIGFLYPNAIASIVNDDVDYIKNTKDAPRIEKLIYVVITSAMVMLSVLFVYLLKSIWSGLSSSIVHTDFVKMIGVTFVYFMCWLQVKCVFSVILSNVSFANNLHSRIVSAKFSHHDD